MQQRLHAQSTSPRRPTCASADRRKVVADVRRRSAHPNVNDRPDSAGRLHAVLGRNVARNNVARGSLLRL